jgi:hypothetical protein
MLAASKTLGQIAEIGGAAFGERFMDKEVPAAIELMQPDKQESPRYAGVLILKELARNSPTYFHSHIAVVLDNILVPLRDQRLIVREGAAELLAACLEIVIQRERQTRSPYLFKILQDAQMGLKQSQPEIIHGSLLTYRELLLHAGMVRLISTAGVALFTLLSLQVHEGDFLGHGRPNPTLQISQRPPCSQDGHYHDPIARGLRHANVYRTLPSQSHGSLVDTIRKAQRTIIWCAI